MAAEPNTVTVTSNEEDQTKSADTENQTSETTENTENEDKKSKVLTQEDFDRAIKKRLAEERAKNEKEYEEKYAPILTEAETLKKEKAEIEKRKQDEALERAKEKNDFEKQLDISTKRFETDLKDRETTIADLRAKLESSSKELSTFKIDSQLRDLATKANAIDPDDVVALITSRHRITLDEKTNDILVDGARDVDLKDIVSETLSKKSHLVKPSFAGKSGGGSPGGDKTPTRAPTFTKEQLDDGKFYDKHRDEIIEYFKSQGG